MVTHDDLITRYNLNPQKKQIFIPVQTDSKDKVETTLYVPTGGQGERMNFNSDCLPSSQWHKTVASYTPATFSSMASNVMIKVNP